MTSELSSIRVLAAGMAWRLFGAQKSGETLFDAVSGNDEQNRMLAGISLVRAGQRSLELIERKIDEGHASPASIRVLADLDEPGVRDVLGRVAASDSELAATARECLTDLEELDALDGE